MKEILIKIKYPKFILLICIIVLAYLLFSQNQSLPFISLIKSSGYLGVFICGLFFTYGFTAPLATAMLLVLTKENNFYLSGMIAGVGALAGDLLIYSFIRLTFTDEIEKLSKERILVFLKLKTPSIIKKYFMPILAGFIIASPLPDEIGISLLAVSNTISTKNFMVYSYLLNTLGIFIILLIGKLI